MRRWRLASPTNHDLGRAWSASSRDRRLHAGCHAATGVNRREYTSLPLCIESGHRQPVGRRHLRCGLVASAGASVDSVGTLQLPHVANDETDLIVPDSPAGWVSPKRQWCAPTPRRTASMNATSAWCTGRGTRTGPPPRRSEVTHRDDEDDENDHLPLLVSVSPFEAHNPCRIRGAPDGLSDARPDEAHLSTESSKALDDVAPRGEGLRGGHDLPPASAEIASLRSNGGRRRSLDPVRPL